jgi:hypothetical protein
MMKNKKIFSVVIMASLCVLLFSCNKKAPSTPAAEPDGSTPDLAITIPVDSSITGLTFDNACDKDWFKVSVTNGTAYVFRTFDLTRDNANVTDTEMLLFTEAGKAALTAADYNDLTSNDFAINDDCTLNCGSDPELTETMSTINYSADYTGMVYILVLPYECGNGDAALNNTLNPGYSFEALKDEPL